MTFIPVVVQHRHVHLSKDDFAQLFGLSEMEQVHPLSHRGQMVSRHVVTIKGKNGMLEDVRVLGPFREHTQVELAPTDAFALGINAPVRISGDIDHSGSCTLVGPKGEVSASHTTIIPARHLHCNAQEANKLELGHHDTIALTVPGTSQVIEHVTVRIHPTFSFEFHLSTDEAAAYWLHTGDSVIL